MQPEVFQLSNGIRVVYLHASSQVAHLGVTIFGGARFENENEEGLAHFLEHCIFKGTKKRKAFHILSRLDSVGGELNAYTGKEEICIYASFTKNHIKRASELLADIALNSSFPEKEIQKEKEIVIDEINSYLDSPSDKIFDDFESHLFKGHTLGNNILGTKESVTSFSRENLLDYVGRFFTANNIVISFVGDIPLKQMKSLLEEDFKSCELKSYDVPKNDYIGQTPFKIRTKEAKFQAHAVIGGLAPSYNEEMRRGMTLLTNILGGPALNSRLNLSIREKYGYSYTIEANYTPYVETGYWSVYFGTDSKYLSKSIDLVYKELKILREKKLGTLQLSAAKEQLKGHLALGLDNNSGLMLGLGKSLLLFNQIDTIEEIYTSIDKLTAIELLEVANQYFAEENISELIFDME
ncbi:MAG: insulinase family protein [Flavobacteriia bacterium]|nr:insulinase family protein [Flavobacteriia bacterium]